MRVKMITCMAGPQGSFLPGQVVEFDDKLANELIAGGYAAPAPAPPAETPDGDEEAAGDETEPPKKKPKGKKPAEANAAGDATT